MYTLETFYKSKDWQKLIDVIKLERVDKNGQLICAHCGKPIVDKYDCIAHHTIFLTDENVNRADISLNPELIQLVHHRCHNRIHNKLGYTKREIYLVYGCPLSGKSTYVSTVAEPGDLIIDINSLWKAVSGCPEKPKVLNSVVFGMRDYLIDCVKYRVGKWDNCYIIGGYPLISERERICKTLGAREIFIDVSKEECISRLNNSENLNKADYLDYINEWWKRYIPSGAMV